MKHLTSLKEDIKQMKTQENTLKLLSPQDRVIQLEL
jgi:hypothetical protein